MMGKRIKKTAAFATAMLLSLGALAGTALAGPPEENVAPPGHLEFVHLNKYVTETEIEDVYKITLDINPPDIEINRPTFVSIVLDASGSMSSSDILPASGTGNISRYKSLEIAVDEFLQVLASTGKDDIYVNISAHGQYFGGPYGTTYTAYPTGTIATHGFESIYDPGTKDLKNKFKMSDPTWFMQGWSNWDYYDTNNIGYSLEKSYGFMRDALMTPSSSGMPAYMPENAARYILVMGDGDDTLSMDYRHVKYVNNPYSNSVYWNHVTDAQNYALALKAPLDPSYKTGSGTPTPVAGIAGGGLGANIWGILVGGSVAHRNSWRTDLLRSDWDTFSTNWKLGNTSGTGLNAAEVRLAATTLTLKSGYPLPTASFADLNDALAFYRGMYRGDGDGTQSGPAVSNINDPPPDTPKDAAYFLSTSIGTAPNSDPMNGVFSSFALEATKKGGGENIEVTDLIGDDFTLYQYPGKKTFEMITDDTDVTLVQNTVCVGKTITWTLNKMKGGCNYKLEYYIKARPGLEKDIWYMTNNEAYISFTNGEGNHVLKYFPEPLVEGKPTPTPTTNGVEFYAPKEETIPAAFSLGEAFAFGTSMPKYTPSVQPKSIKESFTEEGTIEADQGDSQLDDSVADENDSSGSPEFDGEAIPNEDMPSESGENVPRTGEDSSMSIASVIVALLTAALVLKIRLAKSRHDS